MPGIAQVAYQNLFWYFVTRIICKEIDYVSIGTIIKTHSSVSCNPRRQGARKQRQYINTKNNVRVSACL